MGVSGGPGGRLPEVIRENASKAAERPLASRAACGAGVRPLTAPIQGPLTAPRPARLRHPAGVDGTHTDCNRQRSWRAEGR